MLDVYMPGATLSGYAFACLRPYCSAGPTFTWTTVNRAHLMGMTLSFVMQSARTQDAHQYQAESCLGMPWLCLRQDEPVVYCGRVRPPGSLP